MSTLPRHDPFLPKTPFRLWLERAYANRFMAWFLITVGSKIDPWLLRVSNGRVNVTGVDNIAVLHHVGAKSGLTRQTPLAYFTDGDDVILVASKGGASEQPAWYFNIKKHPEVELWVGKHGGRYRAREASKVERERLWQAALSRYAGFGVYQKRTGGREIPIVICTPR
jgi:deazaflavin-dependent oxidoreductase (nitroreductase family)